jgi:2-oxo-4-hydroxy-4-carboxy-5-ureidoimidazoline decarboxylase
VRVRPTLHACLASTEWVEALLAGRPHGDASGWLAAGDAAFDALSDSAVLIALQAHPRIGESPTGGGADADASRREQQQMGGASDDVRIGIAAGNRAYEERFGRVFLIRAAGRPPQEILAELRRRLANDVETELAEARAQLRQITALRLEQALTAPAGHPPA